MSTEPNEPKSRARQYLEVVTGPLEDKRRWRQYKARIKRLPGNYRTAAEALERYLMLFGPGDSADALDMFDDLAELFERGAADGTPIREIFGEDPVQFVETFVQSYSVGRWIKRERDRFTGAIDRAAGEDTVGKDGTDQ
ncbi:DUF1048 domain-containing protein [Actinomadura sp. ATCC 31491]|uniref:DUF1048 domain-containing protein n=1 Tax=Actinomadura luzonensis TaxID=2805427 RepID=A0ABT0FNN1_9ACTN|nr:DUF1048 domain-containing protein [Actinomadura luzonensis]MCK2213508.1 DUF1048 domain-containing protein [Actinomadura luzonensis]